MIKKALVLTASVALIFTGVSPATAATQKVDIYILDTGVNKNGQNNKVNFAAARDFTSDAKTKNKNKDCLGHGTVIASSIQQAYPESIGNFNIIPYKVMKCGAPYASVFDINKALRHIVANASKTRPSVVNLSFGTPFKYMPPIEANIRKLTDMGIPVIVSAGNEGKDSCEKSPANMPQTITVGATTGAITNKDFPPLLSESNTGDCVDVYTVGKLKCYTINQKEKDRCYGTSFSAPIVAGKAAQFLSVQTKKVSTKVVKDAIMRSSTTLAGRTYLPYNTKINSINFARSATGASSGGGGLAFRVQ